MLLGRKDDFAIECVHEPEYPNDHSWVFGRMCVWACGVALGDLDEPACMLNVTEGQIEDCLGRLDSLHDETIDNLSDEAAFALLDSALYRDDDRTDQQVHEESLRYSKFNFLTNWGESFEGIEAFLLKSTAHFRILYRSPCGTMGSGGVTRDELIHTMQAFLAWMDIEKQAVPTESPQRKVNNHADSGTNDFVDAASPEGFTDGSIYLGHAPGNDGAGGPSTEAR